MKKKQITIQKFVGTEDQTKVFYKFTLGDEVLDMSPDDLLNLSRTIARILYDESKTLEMNPTKKGSIVLPS